MKLKKWIIIGVVMFALLIVGCSSEFQEHPSTIEGVDFDLSNYPDIFVKEGIFYGYFVVGEEAPASDNLAKMDIAKGIQNLGYNIDEVDLTILDSEVEDIKAHNLIVIGNPCENTVSAELLGTTDCTFGLQENQALIKLLKNGENVALVVFGYTAKETRMSAEKLANEKLSGTEAIIKEGKEETNDVDPALSQYCQNECGKLYPSSAQDMEYTLCVLECTLG